MNAFSTTRFINNGNFKFFSNHATSAILCLIKSDIGAAGRSIVNNQSLCNSVNSRNTIKVCGSSTTNRNTAVFIKFINIIFFDNACVIVLPIGLTIAGNRRSEFSCRFGSRCFIAALTSFCIEGNITRVQSHARSQQTISNNNFAVQVSFAINISTIGQFASQSIQHLINFIQTHCSDIGVVCNEAHIASNSYIIICRRTLIFMRIENISITAIIGYINLISIILEDISCGGCGTATYNLSYRAAGKIAIGIVKFISPNSSILQRKIQFTFLIGGFIINNAI